MAKHTHKKWNELTESEQNIIIGKMVVMAVFVLPILWYFIHWLFIKHIVVHAASVATSHLAPVGTFAPSTAITPITLPEPTLAVKAAKGAHHAVKAAKAAHAISVHSIPWNTIITTSGQL